MQQADRSRPGRWQQVGADDLVFEFMLNALRLQQGFELDLFSARTGLSLDRIQPILARLQQEGWILLSGDWLKLTPQGQTYLNSLIEQFLDPS